MTKINSSLNKISYQINKNNTAKIIKTKKKEKYVCGGIYYLTKKTISNFKVKYLDIDEDLIFKANSKKFIFVKYYDNSFLDIGTPKDLKKSSKFLKNNTYKPCAFFDRDGVLNEDLGYVCNARRTKWKNKIFKTVKYLNDNNYRVIIITNQAGIAKGYYSLEKFKNFTKWYHDEFIRKGSFIDQTYFSPYHPNAKYKKYKKKSNLRKPGNGMIIQAMQEWEINKKKSFLIGDQITDLEAGKKTGIKSFLVQSDIFSQIKKITKTH